MKYSFPIAVATIFIAIAPAFAADEGVSRQGIISDFDSTRMTVKLDDGVEYYMSDKKVMDGLKKNEKVIVIYEVKDGKKMIIKIDEQK